MTDRGKPRRYPLAPLRHAHGPTTRVLAERLGVSPRTIHRYQRNGLNQAQADHAAIALGTHPVLLWPDWS